MGPHVQWDMLSFEVALSFIIPSPIPIDLRSAIPFSFFFIVVHIFS